MPVGMFRRMNAVAIQNLRVALKLNRAQFARALGIAPFTVKRWEDGPKEPVGLQVEVLKALEAVSGRGQPAVLGMLLKEKGISSLLAAGLVMQLDIQKVP
jgi:DNA-binding XRE family transcriptional regulator